jgi:predicted DNA-binding protein (UPF0278 family)
MGKMEREIVNTALEMEQIKKPVQEDKKGKKVMMRRSRYRKVLKHGFSISKLV